MNVDITRSYPRLKNFAAFILENHLEGFVRDYLRRLVDENPPVMALIKNISEEQLFKNSLDNTKKDFLVPLSEGKSFEATLQGAERWKNYVKTEERPIDLKISDLIVAYECRKLAMYKFLPLYEPISFEMIKEIEDFSKDSEEIMFQVYEEIARNKLEENELFIEKIADASPNVFMLYDAQSRKTKYISKKINDVLGYSAEEIIHIFNEGNSILHPDDFESARAKNQEWLKSGTDYNVMEYRMKHANGEWRWIRYSQNIFKRGKEGNPKEIVGCVIDITDLKKAEEKLKDLNENLERRIKEQTEEIKNSYKQVELIIESFPQLSWTADGNGHIDFYSKNWYTYLGPDYKDLKVAGWGKAVHPDDIKKVMELWNHSMKSGEKYIVESRLLRGSDHTYRWHLSIGIPLKDSSGKIFKWVGTTTDIHDQKTANEQLEQMVIDRTAELLVSNRELASSNNDLEQFAYVASHDLKEPLRMVNSYLQLLSKTLEGKLDDHQKEFLGYISSGAERMNVLIRDLLNYSKIINDPASLKKLDLNNVIAIILQNLSDAIKETHAVIKTGNLPIIIGVESQQIQLFQNLISNAIKYKHPGRNPVIEINAHAEPKEWIFSVKDNGIGIAPQFRERIFIIFQRLHNRAEYSGTGIGLSVCKKIVELYGGKIWCESTQGIGSTFYFTIQKPTALMEELFDE